MSCNTRAGGVSNGSQFPEFIIKVALFFLKERQGVAQKKVNSFVGVLVGVL